MGILGKDAFVPAETGASGYIVDLNLDSIIAAMEECWGRKIEKFYGGFPGGAQAAAYRRETYLDIERHGLYEVLCDAYNLVEKAERSILTTEKFSKKLQRMICHVFEASLYCTAVDEVTEALNALNQSAIASEGLKWLINMLNAYTATPEYKRLNTDALELRKGLAGVRLSAVYEDDRLNVSVREAGQEDVTQGSENVKSDETKAGEDGQDDLRNEITSPFRASRELEGLEMEILLLISEKCPKLFKRIKEFDARNGEYMNPEVMAFFDEVAFYLSFMCLEKKMAADGFTMTMPVVTEEPHMKADGLYDLALAIANVKRGREVVSNELRYEKGEQFFVLTGPNQGGKTTYARSLGQLIFFTKMGLKVPALSAEVRFFDSLLTHFSVEESIETGRGKLMEELIRLEPMMSETAGSAFVVINELFTTAANYDACIMGRKVLQHFIGRNCSGIYVTHLSELLEGTDHAVGLCAQMNDEGVQTFKILRRVMEYNNCAAAQVRKYNLGYDELKARLAGGEEQ